MGFPKSKLNSERDGGMEDDVKAAISDSKKGSIPAVMIVASALQKNDSSSPLRLGLVSAIFDAFAAFKKQSGPHMSDPIISAMKACMLALIKVGPEYVKSRPKLKERLESSRELICSHLNRTLRTLADDVSRGDGSEELLDYVWLSLDYLEDTGAILAIGEMFGSVAAFKVASRIWLEEWSRRGNSLAAKILRTCFEHMHSSEPPVDPQEARNMKRRSMILIASSLNNFSTVDVLVLALSRLRRSDVMDLTVHFDVLMFLMGGVSTDSSSEFRDLERAFEYHRGASVAQSCLRKVLKRLKFNLETPDSSMMTGNALEAMSRCLQVLYLGFTSSKSIGTLNRALSHDLVPLLASCSTRCVFLCFDRDDQGIIRQMMEQIIGDSLVIRSSVRAALRGIKAYLGTFDCDSPTAFKLLEVFPSLTSSPIRTSWEKLFRRLNHQSHAFQMIVQERKDTVFSCENPTCDIKGTTTELYKCAGCYLIFFCSKDCQVKCWQEHGHKDRCERFRRIRDSSGVSALDGVVIGTQAYERASRMLSSRLRNVKDRPENLSEPLAANVKFHGDYLGDVTVWKQAPAERMMFYHLPFVDKNSTPGGNGEGAEGFLRTLFIVGGTERVLHFNCTFRRKAAEGEECACCRFHDADSARTRCVEWQERKLPCPVHF